VVSVHRWYWRGDSPVFDVTHEVGHGIAGLLGVIGFPIAALLLSVALGRNKNWRTARRPLLWLANLRWISVVLLMLTLAIMTMQMIRINGGHLPQHAPRSLPPGVLALDGWADRLIVLSNCAWVLVAAWHATQFRGKHS
jgi:biotin transporter BioY